VNTFLGQQFVLNTVRQLTLNFRQVTAKFREYFKIIRQGWVAAIKR